MSKYSILDCTLRDGGYINDWQFGKAAIKEIVSNLAEANIDIIECGFLRDVPYDENISVYSDVTQIIPFISPKRLDALYVGMIAIGDIAPEKIAPYDGSSIDGVRVTFHKHEWEEAKKAAQHLMSKGYKVFIQPVGTTSYSDTELLHLIDDVNELQPYAFYLVDTLGMMYRHDVLRFFYLIDENLDEDICLGFHSHNNLQISFSNAADMLRQQSKRNLIIDASVYGMGRGAGNLATELLAEYINNNIELKYSIIPLLTIADQYLMSIYSEHRWGYALPYFLSSKEKCHPNYASHLLKKDTLTIEAISKLLSLLPEDQKDLYHKDLIEGIYNNYQSCNIDDTLALETLLPLFNNKDVLVLGPGATLRSYKAEILKYKEKQSPVTVSINFVPDDIEIDALFISNQKRSSSFQKTLMNIPLIIATSNLINELPSATHFINYANYLGDGSAGDNAGAMFIRLLSALKPNSVTLAGFDGFSLDTAKNYAVPAYKKYLNKSEADKKNRNISRQMKLALSELNYTVLTPTRYDI